MNKRVRRILGIFSIVIGVLLLVLIIRNIALERYGYSVFYVPYPAMGLLAADIALLVGGIFAIRGKHWMWLIRNISGNVSIGIGILLLVLLAIRYNEIYAHIYSSYTVIFTALALTADITLIVGGIFTIRGKHWMWLIGGVLVCFLLYIIPPLLFLLLSFSGY
ncbi:hypothetical protein ACFLVH_02040 [Chloroflexota bacterium]